MKFDNILLMALDSDTYFYNSEHVIKAIELLQLYYRFFETMGFDIIIEHNANDYENWEEEYLDQNGATDESLELFKKIKKLEKELSEVKGE